MSYPVSNVIVKRCGIVFPQQVSQELKKLASLSKRPQGRLDRSKSAAVNALKGLKFISKTDGGAGWAAVDKKFDSLTAKTNGLLPRSLFCECIGIFDLKIQLS